MSKVHLKNTVTEGQNQRVQALNNDHKIDSNRSKNQNSRPNNAYIISSIPYKNTVKNLPIYLP